MKNLIIALALFVFLPMAQPHAKEETITIYGGQVECFPGQRAPEIRLPKGENLGHIKITCLNPQEYKKVKSSLTWVKECLAVKDNPEFPVHYLLTHWFFNCHGQIIFIEVKP